MTARKTAASLRGENPQPSCLIAGLYICDGERLTVHANGKWDISKDGKVLVRGRPRRKAKSDFANHDR